VGVDQWQAGCQHTLSHAVFALSAFSGMEGRSVEHHQQFGASVLCVGSWRVEPGVFTDQQADPDRFARCGGHVKNTGVPARHEIAPVVEHLVVGQFALGVGVCHLPFRHHARCVVNTAHGHAALPAPTGAVHHPRRMTHHDAQAFQPGRLTHHRFQGIIASINEGRTQEQVFRCIAAQGQFWRDQQAHAPAMSVLSRLNNFSGIAHHVAHHKIELGHANWKCHEVRDVVLDGP
jgi:hypothetical protein